MVPEVYKILITIRSKTVASLLPPDVMFFLLSHPIPFKTLLSCFEISTMRHLYNYLEVLPTLPSTQIFTWWLSSIIQTSVMKSHLVNSLLPKFKDCPPLWNKLCRSNSQWTIESSKEIFCIYKLKTLLAKELDVKTAFRQFIIQMRRLNKFMLTGQNITSVLKWPQWTVGARIRERYR